MSNLSKDAEPRNPKGKPRRSIGKQITSKSERDAASREPSDSDRLQDLKCLAVSYYESVLYEHGATDEFAVESKNGKVITPEQYLRELHKHEPEALQQFYVGLADGSFCSYARDKDYTDEELIDAGLMREETGRDYWREGLVLFPHIVAGVISHFSQKDPAGKTRSQAQDKYRLKDCLFYNQDALDGTEEIILVEGQNDVISLVTKAGEANVIGCCGMLNAGQAKYLIDRKTDLKTVYLLFDNDKAGRKHAAKARRGLKKHFDIIDLGPGLGDFKDIDELLCTVEDPYKAMDRLRAYRPPALDVSSILRAFGIDVLGEGDDQSIILWIRQTGKRWTIKNPNKLTLEELLQACGQDVTHRHLWERNEAPDDGTYAIGTVRRAIALAANKAPRLAEGNSVGQGIWKHGSNFLIVNGDRAHVYDGEDFKKVSRPQLGKKILELDQAGKWMTRLLPSVKQMDHATASEAVGRLREMLGQWNWKHSADPEVVAGLITATWIQACWTWRPLISVIGDSDCGKSTFLDELVALIFGSWTIKTDRGTEAGIRQAIGNDSSPVLIDEFDKYRHRQQVLELFRTSSRGGKILRGTQNQNGMAFGVKHLAWFAAIESGDILGQDRNRFIRLELDKPKNRGVLNLPGPSELAKVGRELAAAALWAAPAAIPLADKIKSTRVKGVHGRLIESFSVPAAMLAVVQYGREASSEQAEEILRHLLDGRKNLIAQDEANHEQLLQDILGSLIRVSAKHEDGTMSSERSVAQLLDDNNDRYADDLEARGIRLVSSKKLPIPRSTLFLAHATVRQQLLKNTRWNDCCIDQLLLRLPGAKKSQQRCGGKRNRPWGVSLPWPGCLERLELQDGEQDTQTHANTEE